MNPVPRPMVVTAGIALAGACVLGLYLGVEPSLERMPGDAEAAPASSAAAAMAPGAKTVEATALKTDTPPPSAAPPASSALALVEKPKPKPSAADATPSSDASALPASGAQAARRGNPPEPPALYSPDEGPAPAPAGENSGANTPPY